MAPAVTGFVLAAEEAECAVCGDPWSHAAHRVQGHYVFPLVGLAKSRQAPPGVLASVPQGCVMGPFPPFTWAWPPPSFNPTVCTLS